MSSENVQKGQMKILNLKQLKNTEKYIAGRDTIGNILVIHCSSSANNVVITSNSIFGFAARPSCY